MSCRAERSDARAAARRGLSLIEVLVSIVVLSSGAVVVSDALARVAYATTVADQQALGHLIALTKMAEIEQAARVAEAPLEPQHGQVIAGRDRFTWTVSPTPVADDPRLQSVELSVQWRHGEVVHEQKLTTLVTIPAMADANAPAQ